MRNTTATIQTSTMMQTANNSTIQAVKLEGKAKPFGAHFTTKLEGVNSKLVCALSARATCIDDMCGGNPIC